MPRTLADGTAPVGGNDALSAGAGYPDATAPAGGVGPLAGAGYADATAPVGGTDALAAPAPADAAAGASGPPVVRPGDRRPGRRIR